MGSTKGKQTKIDAAFGRLADMIQSGHLLAGTDPALYMAAHWLYRAGDRMKEGCNVYTGESNAAGQGRREATYPEPACSQGGCQ